VSKSNIELYTHIKRYFSKFKGFRIKKGELKKLGWKNAENIIYEKEKILKHQR